ncbi:flagellar FlbD family protein [Metabacillus halosaccharovorans]|uniref:Flagellar FlbD family protein n=1 Tax=Metabacillus halosaccharovorans TaxID=930124 RepID=A0ABT3DKU6_9BACI|nr:flagellar FlbD family protein [Metabacillus halosaccharovorans]MCV9887666.1 flagellar FlbD family protein [Metabacillus halosaccharovorans]
MIQLTRLNGKSFTLNALYIEVIESFPDTTITLTNGHKYVVKEPQQEVTMKISSFYRDINVLSLKKDTEVFGDE